MPKKKLEDEVHQALPPHVRYTQIKPKKSKTASRGSIVSDASSGNGRTSTIPTTGFQADMFANEEPGRFSRRSRGRKSSLAPKKSNFEDFGRSTMKNSTIDGKVRAKSLYQQSQARVKKMFSKVISPTEDKMVHKRGVQLMDDGFMDHLEMPEVEINDLFFDLIFVCGVSVLNECMLGKTITLFQYFTWFFINWCLWRSYTVYESVLGENDLVHKLYGGMYGLLLAYLIIAMKHANFQHASFTVALAYLFQAGMIWRARNHINQQDEQDTFGERFPIIVNYLEKWSKGCVQAFITWICVSIFYPTDTVIACAIAVVPLHDLYFSFNIDFEKVLHPPFEYLKDRFASYIMIVLGECIVDIVNASDDAELNMEFYLVVTFTFLIIIFVKFYLFDVDEFEAEEHAFLVSAGRRMTCQYSICFKGMGVALLGASLSMIFRYHIKHDVSMQHCMGHLGLACGLLMICNFIDRSIHLQRLEMFPHAIALWRLDRIFELGALVVIICQAMWWSDETPAWKPLALTFAAFFIDDLLDYLPTIVHLHYEHDHRFFEERLFCSSELLFKWNPQPLSIEEEFEQRSSKHRFSQCSMEEFRKSFHTIEEESQSDDDWNEANKTPYGSFLTTDTDRAR